MGVTEFASDFEREISLNNSLLKLTKEISESDTIQEACEKVAHFTNENDGTLLSLKFCDWSGERPTIRPYSAYPDSIRSVSRHLEGQGGCAFANEARLRLAPFSYSDVDRSKYNTLLHRRLFQEFDKLGFKDIAVFPVVIGRGMAVATIGIDRNFDREMRSWTSNITTTIAVAFVSKFPEISQLFDDKILSKVEAKVIKLFADGHTEEEVIRDIGFSSQTLRIIWICAGRKLEARNRYEVINRAITMGEISGRLNF